MTRPYIFVDAFCGAGGLSLGLQKAGFEVGTAFDINDASIKTYRANVSSNCFVGDIYNLTGRKIKKKLGSSVLLDVLAGGPPCQGFSRQNTDGHLGDERNELVLEFARLVTELKPRAFVLENVDQLGKSRGEEFLQKLEDELFDYIPYPEFYNCVDYGLAQTRVRYVIVGIRSDVEVPFDIPSPKRGDRKTVWDIIGHLPEPPADGSEHPRYPNHYKGQISEANRTRISKVPEGGGWRDLPRNLQLPCHKKVDSSKGGWPDVYGRIRKNGQVPTITGGFDNFSRGRYAHPTQDRALTPREAALLQGFPRRFRFYGNRSDVRSQIGNAVPPPLARVIGGSLLRTLLRSDEQ